MKRNPNIIVKVIGLISMQMISTRNLNHKLNIFGKQNEKTFGLGDMRGIISQKQ